MSLTLYIIIMTLTTALSWSGWYLVITTLTPTDTGVIGLVLFYASLTLSLGGTCALLGLAIRMFFLKQEFIFQKVIISFRQGIFFALLIDGILFLQSMHLLTWYNIFFLLLGLTAVEFFVISLKHPRHR